ncbi:hypothetical protein PUN28_004975 [Cardiocondyla obscurior]|uniref:Uncharacterized protein n=1 Tax=Cardiocondyla obscurior TaxID=286306 RepID=A0AAW2GDD0_9HYME
MATISVIARINYRMRIVLRRVKIYLACKSRLSDFNSEQTIPRERDYFSHRTLPTRRAVPFALLDAFPRGTRPQISLASIRPFAGRQYRAKMCATRLILYPPVSNVASATFAIRWLEFERLKELDISSKIRLESSEKRLSRQ